MLRACNHRPSRDSILPSYQGTTVTVDSAIGRTLFLNTRFSLFQSESHISADNHSSRERSTKLLVHRCFNVIVLNGAKPIEKLVFEQDPAF